MRKNIFLILFILLSISIFAENLNRIGVERIPGVFDTLDFSAYSDSALFDLLSNWNNFPQPVKYAGFQMLENSLNDTLTAPFIIYIPENYDNHKKTPLLIYLHGGVGRKEFVENFRQFAVESPFIPFAEENNWIMLFPAANIKTMWWDKTGMENIEAQILYLKSRFNIDDDRVFMTGFSDGGSGSFHFALTNPTDFASFYPLNGFISVGSNSTRKPVFLPNLRNRFISAVNTDKDGLYPASKTRKLMELALSAGANILYKEYWGIRHEFAYSKQEIPLMFTYMKTHPRQIFRPQIYWETANLEFNRCDWLEINKLDTLATAQDWQKQFNLKLADDRVHFGFYDDREFTGKGVKITKIVQGSVADSINLRKDDIIIGMDGIPVDSIRTLLELRDKKKRGEAFVLNILRDETELDLTGRFPDVVYYDAFNYNLKSGAVKAEYFGNRFEIETSRVKEITLYFHPAMINLNIPVTVILNGKKVYSEKIGINREFMLESFRKHKDRTALWIRKMNFITE